MLHDASSYGDSSYVGEICDTKDIFGTEIVKRAQPQLQLYNQQDATHDSVSTTKKEKKIDIKKNQKRYGTDVSQL